MIDYKDKILEKFFNGTNHEAQERYDHSIGVSKAICEIIKDNNLNVDLNKAKLTGLIHDYAKYTTKDEFLEILTLEKNQEDLKVLDMAEAVWHALLGPYIIKKELEINDEEILEAIKYHTTGNKEMSLLGECLFLADFIEETRHGQIFEFARKLAKIDYRKAICYILELKINTVKRRGQTLAKITEDAYEYYKKYKMNSLDKAKMIALLIDSTLVQDLVIYDCRKKTPFYDYSLVSTTLSERQMDAVVSHVRSEFDVKGYEIGSTWTLIDLGDVLLHVFYKDERLNYGIDRLYIDLPIIDFNK